MTTHHGHVLDVLPTMGAGSVHCVVTSPPYWGLRDYGLPPVDWPAVAYEPMPGIGVMREVPAWSGCLGLEPDPWMFIGHLVAVFREVRRVLRDDGTVWLNLGDNYTGARGGVQGMTGDLRRRSAATAGARVRQFEVGAQGLARKQLMMMPARLALALQADGWVVRSEIVWAKKSPMPEAVTDRPTCAHEKVWLLSKGPDYFYDAEAVKQPGSENSHSRGAGVNPKATAGRETAGRQNESWSAAVRDVVTKANMRNVWHLGPDPFPEAHFATFPRAIPERAIMAGTSARGCCAECGAPWVREVERESMQVRQGPGREALKESAIGAPSRSAPTGTMTSPPKSRTTGWRPICEHVGPRVTVPCTVLDPFMGSGTTAEVAQKLGRAWVGIEAQGDYLPMQERRTAQGALGL